MQFGGAAKRLTRACGRALAGVVDEHDGALEAALEVAQEAEDVRPHPFGCALKRFGVATLDQAGRDLVGKRSGGFLPAPGFLVAPAPLGGPCERWRPSGERVQPSWCLWGFQPSPRPHASDLAHLTIASMQSFEFAVHAAPSGVSLSAAFACIRLSKFSGDACPRRAGARFPVW